MSTRPGRTTNGSLGTNSDATEERIFKSLDRRRSLLGWIVAIFTAGGMFTAKFLEKADKTEIAKVGDRLMELNNRWSNVLTALSEKADSKTLNQVRDDVRDLTIEVGILKKTATTAESLGVLPRTRRANTSPRE